MMGFLKENTLKIAGWKTIKNKRNSLCTFLLFFIVFRPTFALNTCLKLIVTFEPNMRFAWGKKHLKEQKIFFHFNETPKIAILSIYYHITTLSRTSMTRPVIVLVKQLLNLLLAVMYFAHCLELTY